LKKMSFWITVALFGIMWELDKIPGPMSKIYNKATGKSVYPWRYTFDREMPGVGIGYVEWAGKDA
jgi:hypothetical protein